MSAIKEPQMDLVAETTRCAGRKFTSRVEIEANTVYDLALECIRVGYEYLEELRLRSTGKGD